MNVKRWVMASIVVAVVIAVLETTIHGLLLQPIYQQTASVWRPDMEPLTPLMWLGYLIFAPFFVWIFAKGLEAGKGALGQGVRFGLVFGVGLSAMSALVWYVVLPIPATLAWAWFAAGVVVYLGTGVAAALVYRA